MYSDFKVEIWSIGRNFYWLTSQCPEKKRKKERKKMRKKPTFYYKGDAAAVQV